MLPGSVKNLEARDTSHKLQISGNKTKERKTKENLEIVVKKDV